MTDGIAIGTSLIKHCEGCRLAPYLDLHDLWTIAFGNRFGVDGSPIGPATPPLAMYQAEALLRDTLLGDVAPMLLRVLKRPLPDYEMGALISLAYNIGDGQFGHSTLLRYLNLGAVEMAAMQFDRWVFCRGRRVNGLVARRALEKAVFLGQVDPVTLATVSVPTIPHPVFASDRTTTNSTDDLNAKELVLLRGSTATALEAANP